MAKKKIQLQDANGNVLHPLTLGECVTMSNGENLDTLMSKSQMFTPTITQDKSMFKVGTGIDVDYSANVKDGAYESLVFKGKSLVNLITSGEMRAIANGGWVFANSNIRVDMLKPLTDYTLITYVLQNTLSGGSGFAVGKDGGTANGLPFCSLKIPSGEVGIYKLKMRTQSEITGDTGLRQQIYNNVASGQIVFKQVLLEGDYTTRDIPYFTGLCDSKMPILQNTGENLFDPNSPLPDNLNYFYNSDNKNQLTTHAQMLSCAIPVIKGKTYSFYFNHDEIPLKVHKSGVFPTFVSGGVGGNGYAHNVRTITAPMDGYFGIMFCYTEDGTTDNWTKVARDWKKQLKLTIVEEKSINTYIPYKTNILRTSEEIVLRSLPNGVCDTYNARTGEYVKRIGERTLNGSEAWIANSGTDKQFEDVWVFHNQESLCNGTVRLCDKLQARENANKNAEFIRGGGAYIFVYISKNKVQNHNANDFKTWLQSNPLTVQYELAEPVTTIVKPSTMTPFAYQNGHVIVESGFEGQSLLPEIEYSVVTGRTGQVTQNTKVLRKQEQQIIGLEELLLTQVVQMEYERTLLQFDYELQMMMLG